MLLLLGSNHRSAPVNVRERLSFSSEHLGEALSRLRSDPRIAEAMILSTCNRMEILVRATCDAREGLDAIKRFVAVNRELTREEIDRHCYEWQAEETVRHLFQVASGLDSMILGEPQILGQVKQAYLAARQFGAAGAVLDRLLQQCLATAKRVRTETDIGRNAVSVAFAAVELARKIFGKLQGRSVLLLGAGKMSDLLAKHLVSDGIGRMVVASRTYTHAVASAKRVGGDAVHWDDGIAELSRVDIVISATGATRPILGKREIARTARARRSSPLFLIDIAVPRDIDPDVNDLDNVYLYDIDALNQVVGQNLDDRRRAAMDAEALIADDVAAFGRWRQTQEITPTIVALRESLIEVGRGEIERFRRKLGALDERQEKAVEELTRAVIQKILHRPIRHLKQSVDRGDMEDTAALYREVFGIEPAQRVADGSTAAPTTGDASSTTSTPGAGPQRVLRGGKDDEPAWRQRS